MDSVDWNNYRKGIHHQGRDSAKEPERLLPIMDCRLGTQRVHCACCVWAKHGALPLPPLTAYLFPADIGKQ
jgi:hypothetical protein